METPVKFTSSIHTITMSICPQIGSHVAIPHAFDSRAMRETLDEIAADVGELEGVTVQNAMEMSFGFTLDVELENGETPQMAEERITKAFADVWNRRVKRAYRGRDLSEVRRKG